MPAAGRKGDTGSDHDGFAPHSNPKHPPHGRSLSGSSGTVFINGKPAGRVGNAIDCGGSVSSGSEDVSIGG
jgi:uncharacterized Zn-binding protein involved in type VI secretion